MTLAYLALAIAVLLGVGGQVLLKAGSTAPDFISQIFRISTITGLACYCISAVLYMLALRRIPVSVALPSAGLSYAVVAVVAHYVWNEPLGWPQIGGIAMVVAGVVLLNQTA